MNTLEKTIAQDLTSKLNKLENQKSLGWPTCVTVYKVNSPNQNTTNYHIELGYFEPIVNLESMQFLKSWIEKNIGPFSKIWAGLDNDQFFIKADTTTYTKTKWGSFELQRLIEISKKLNITYKSELETLNTSCVFSASPEDCDRILNEIKWGDYTTRFINEVALRLGTAENVSKWNEIELAETAAREARKEARKANR